MKNTMKLKNLVIAVSLSAASALVIADDNKIDPTTLAITMEEASTIAKQQVDGIITSAEVESEDNTTIWEIEILDAQGITYEVEIDATNGTVLEVEKDD